MFKRITIRIYTSIVRRFIINRSFHTIYKCQTSLIYCTRFVSSRLLIQFPTNVSKSTGTFQSSTSPEHHLHLILSNITLLRSSGGLIKIFEATKQAGNRWDQFSISVDSEVQLQQSSTGSLGGNTRQQGLDEANAEIAILLAILYLMVEVLRGDANWAEELSKFNFLLPFFFDDEE